MKQWQTKIQQQKLLCSSLQLIDYKYSHTPGNFDYLLLQINDIISHINADNAKKLVSIMPHTPLISKSITLEV